MDIILSGTAVMNEQWGAFHVMAEGNLKLG